ncbi:hypothetical protein WL29_20285 [Burkholderia ubonensis]|uniref:CRISPR-associated protein n=1 Tax=Burkholderia ubonensis TaxID=101571 RepID=A0A106QCE4_9BURK|nr:hypothetical protein [Burkholderia ubonensis]KWA83708.1 hypothetical protein WL29_20285 [Burkholderia ubonensis]
MDRFVIRAELWSPAILSPLAATLDGLLGGVLFDTLQDVDAAHKAIPLVQTDELYHASVAQFEGAGLPGRHTQIAGLRATHDLRLDLIKTNAQGQPHRALDVARRSGFGNVMNSYATVSAGAVYWHATGDAEAVLDLLEPVNFIGKRRACGFGQVAGWELIESELDGLVDANGLPLRPIPLDRWLTWGFTEDAVRADTAWKPAYWNPEHRAICAVPGDTRMEARQ